MKKLSLATLALVALSACSHHGAVDASDQAITQGDDSTDGSSPGDVAASPGSSTDDPSVPPQASACDPAPLSGDGDSTCGKLGWAWNGSACAVVQGCACKGACDLLFDDPNACAAKYAACAPPPASACDALAADAAAALAAARACNASSAQAATCTGSVPTIGCDAPVADASSEETKKYLQIFEAYLEAGCPLTDPPCPSPVTGTCVESADGSAACE